MLVNITKGVIMCCMKRTAAGGWDAIGLGTETDGYCYDYQSINETIQRLYRGALALQRI